MADSSKCVFSEVPMAPKIEVFQLSDMFNKCSDEKKVNLGVGAYRTDEGKPWILPVVKEAEKQMVEDCTINHEYLPVAGLPDFREAATKLMLGADHVVLKEGRARGFQALGGTGALALAANFLHKVLGYDRALVSNPTWGNHIGVFDGAGFKEVKKYSYFDSSNLSLDIDGMLNDLSKAPPKSVVILHAVAHNPTGIDPTEEQWKEILDVCIEKQHFIVMDCAYQGFASGDLEKDAFATRYFASQNIDMLIAQSFSKNFGLYNERTGNMIVISKDANKMDEIQSQMEIQIRRIWSNPPMHGARVVAKVLTNDKLYAAWKENIATMANRIIKMRQMLRDKLRSLGTPGNWDHIVSQIGMFSYTGLTEKQVEKMIAKNIFLLKSGRISMAGLNTHNVDYVAQAMHDAVQAPPHLKAKVAAEHASASEFITFAEFARRKLHDEKDATVIRTSVAIDGVLEAEAKQMSRPDSPEEFVKIRIEGSVSSLDTIVVEPEGEKQPETETVDVTNASSIEDQTGIGTSIRTLPGTTRTSVRSYKTRSAQTLKPEEVMGSSVPARFEGTMLTPVYFEGLMISSKQLQELLQQAKGTQQLSLPVTFKGGMLTSAFRQISENKDQSVPVKFKGELKGVLGSNNPDLPVLFEGKMAAKTGNRESPAAKDAPSTQQASA